MAAAVTATRPSKFVRRTALTKDEKRINFKQVDRDAIEVLTSREACKQTPLMCKIYLRLLNAPARYLERDGVLRFTGEEDEGKWLTAWEQLLKLLEVASATASKALTWMHEEGVIGYDAHKNGVGIRVFLNRAQSSIAPANPAPEKNLPRARASSAALRTSTFEAPFKDSYADLDMLELNLNPGAPKNGAEENCSTSAIQPGASSLRTAMAVAPVSTGNTSTARNPDRQLVLLEEMIARLKSELEPWMKATTKSAIAREHSQTREWFEAKALPKAIRVAQKESYELLRKLGGQGAVKNLPSPGLHVGRATPPSGAPPRPRTAEEIQEVAETCVALWEVQGKSIDSTLAEISAPGKGWLLPQDEPLVRRAVEKVLSEKQARE